MAELDWVGAPGRLGDDERLRLRQDDRDLATVTLCLTIESVVRRLRGGWLIRP